MKKKILLLHGWNYSNYTKLSKTNDAWDNRKKFVKELEKEYIVYKLNFPGFCGEKEPDRSWDLKDFAKYVKDYLDKNNLRVDYILGYSFGGAVAITYNNEYDNNQKLYLISPAIIRNKKKTFKFIKTPKILNKIRNKVRDFYLIYIVKNNYMKYGTKFLRNTYQVIVRKELIDDLLKIKPSNIKIIYGSLDNMVNPNLVYDIVPLKYKERIKIIENKTHDIANEDPITLVNELKKW